MAVFQLKLESPWAPKSLHVENELPSEHGSAHLTSQTSPPPKDEQNASCLEPTVDLEVSLMTHLRQVCTMQQRTMQRCQAISETPISKCSIVHTSQFRPEGDTAELSVSRIFLGNQNPFCSRADVVSGDIFQFLNKSTWK